MPDSMVGVAIGLLGGSGRLPSDSVEVVYVGSGGNIGGVLPVWLAWAGWFVCQLV